MLQVKNVNNKFITPALKIIGSPFFMCFVISKSLIEDVLPMYRPVVPWCAGCAMAHPDFGRSVNPISTKVDRFCPPNY